MNIQSSEDAAHLARQIVERDTRITTLVGELRAQDMLGLECAQTIELEELSAKNAAAAPFLARWFLDQPAALRLPPPLVRPQISLVLVRPDSAPDRTPSNLQIGGNRVTAVMLDAAEDLLHTLTTGERTLPSDLYEVVARAFGVTRDDAKSRLLRAAYGGRGAPMTPGEPST
jgi:hypothetical protein